MARWYDQLLVQLTETLGPAALEYAFGRGARLGIDQALQLAPDATDQTS